MSTITPLLPQVDDSRLATRYAAVRQFSRELCKTLEPEDCCIQSMPDVSPTRWHLAHTTWFFETFILAHQPGYQPCQAEYSFLFNSYYNAIGQQFPRARRGLLSRPTVSQVFEYRREIDEQMMQLLTEANLESQPSLRQRVELGLHHEQQHQELMLTDIKHVLSCNPLYPTYRTGIFQPVNAPTQSWIDFEEGLYKIGYEGTNFAYDNEQPRHRTFLEAFQINNRLVTCGEYLDFIADGGYQRPELWLSQGWAHSKEHGWQAPLYWHKIDDQWHEFTLAGLRPLNPQSPVCHLSYFEADAFARWTDARLPTEAEWEIASNSLPIDGNWADTLLASGSALHPTPMPVDTPMPTETAHPSEMFGCVWQWTASPYTAYPGYRPAAGALGEYNGKFMCNQSVLRGGSCATPSGHIRRTYRNFFPPEARWQFSGLRLAK
jgi:ergothioneine biosynthesis protein EgtB